MTTVECVKCFSRRIRRLDILCAKSDRGKRENRHPLKRCAFCERETEWRTKNGRFPS